MNKKFLAAVTLATFIFAGGAFAADIDLGEGYHVPSDFSSILITNSDGTAIQNAVDHIQNGGTIFLSGYFKLTKGSINIKKNLTLQGIGNATLERGKSGERVIRCQGNITLENLTITGGFSANGGGVKLDGGKVKIISCDIRNNRGIFVGGGIHSKADELVLISCDIHNNISLCLGGGISALSGTISMDKCKITGNIAAHGGGIALTRSVNVTSQDCDISSNKLASGNTGDDKDEYRLK